MITLLKLIVNNKISNQENVDEKLTCRNSCEYFDEITESCSIKANVNVDSTYEVLRCTQFFGKITSDENYEGPKAFRLQEDVSSAEDEESDSMFKELLGQKEILDVSNYPLEPDFPSRRTDASWFVAPCGNYGCWVINKSSCKFSVVKNMEEVVKGWHESVYKSPIPLHDHKSSLGLASRIAWVVDEDGYGQYALLINGNVSDVRYPRPHNWKRSY